jgi:diacylglycerol kinase family enzyme
MLLIVNPRASSYSRDDERTVARELGRAFGVATARTETPGHATALSAEAARKGGAEVVAVLGGDGAVNEVANGLAGTGVPLAPLPGGRTNVFCRILGLPTSPGRAAAILAELASRTGAVERRAPIPTRDIDLGTLNGRHFTFGSGIGLSAVANRRLNAHGLPGQRLGSVVFVLEAAAVLARYLREPPRMAIEAAGRRIEGVSVVAQNAQALTYLGRHPLPLCEGAGLVTGSISLAALGRASLRSTLPIGVRIVAGRGPSALGRADVESLPAVTAARVTTLDGRPFPVEVDGDFVGEHEDVVYGVVPSGLTVVWPVRPARRRGGRPRRTIGARSSRGEGADGAVGLAGDR